MRGFLSVAAQIGEMLEEHVTVSFFCEVLHGVLSTEILSAI